jgi:hypothetical protein
MRGRHVYLPLLAGAISAFALAGCGSGDSAPIQSVQGASGATGAGGAGALSKSAFIEQADGICAEANEALSSLEGSTVASDAKILATQEAQITHSELDSLRSLAPPNQDRSTLDEFLSALESEVNALMQKQDAANQGGDTSSASAEAADAEASAVAAAEAYGLKDCAKGSHASSPDSGVTTTVPTTVTPTTPAPTTAVPTTPAPAAPAPPSGGAGGGTAAGGTAGGGTGGGTGGGAGGTGDSGGVSP